ncbi:MAG: hypothetical protein EBW28_07090 [Actinobacteria bacterium]|nr:hypothetical protein [Actinomycetota bacterium]
MTVKKILLGIAASIGVVGLLGAFLIFKVLPDTNVESIGYQYAVREDISNLPAIATPAGYTSLNPQSFFSGKSKVKKLAQSVVEGQTTELGKAEALIDWVQLHVRPQTSAPTTVITDDYVNIIKRGWGYCDQMAHVFATMATYVGLEAQQLQLYRNDGVSPHTLAMVKIDGKWRIASTWRGVIPKNSKGDPYTKTGFVQIPASDLDLYDRARNAHLDLSYKLAQNLYSQVIMNSSSIILKDEAQFALGMTFYDEKDYVKALETFNKIVAGDKNSAWHISARRMSAESLIKMGKVKEALAILDSIGTPQSKVRANLVRNKLSIH